MRKNIFILFTILCFTIAFVSNHALARSSGMVSVTNWNEDCCASCENLPEWNNMISRWFINVGQVSEHGSKAFDDFTKSQVDGAITKDFLTDYPTLCHRDDEWIDMVEIAIVGMHGSDLYYYWEGQPRKMNAVNKCPARAWEMNVGDEYSINLVLSSCDSANRKYFINSWDDWNVLFGGIHQLNGFHGSMWIRTDLRDDYRMFADDGFDIPLKSAFIENLYKNELYYSGDELTWVDQCPVAASSGETTSEAIDHRDNFYYYSWGAEPQNNNYYAIQGVWGCDPQFEVPYGS